MQGSFDFVWAPLREAHTTLRMTRLNAAPYRLFCNYAAGYAVAGVSGGIGLHIVGFGVDYDGGAAVAEERVGAVGQGYVVVLQLGVGDASIVDVEVFHVASVMTFGILEAVLLAIGIEVRAGGFEVRAVAFGILVKVDSVLAGREIVKIKLEGDSGPVLRDDDGARGLTIGVFNSDLRFGCAWNCGDD